VVGRPLKLVAPLLASCFVVWLAAPGDLSCSTSAVALTSGTAAKLATIAPYHWRATPGGQVSLMPMLDARH
jgi:hypothetical protein